MEIFLPLLSLSTSVGLTLFLQIWGISWASDNGGCNPTDCSQEPRFPGDAPFSCSIGNRKECDGFSYSALEKATAKIFPVQIASLNVYQKKFPTGDSSTLNISFQLPKDFYTLQRTKAIKVEVDSKEHQEYNICRLFNFENVTFTEHDAKDPRVLNYPCYYGLLEQREVSYTVKVTSLPDEVQVKYYITLPVKPKDNKWRSTLVLWQPDDAMEFRVMFDDNPGIHDYIFTLYTYDGDDCGIVAKGTVVETKSWNKDGSNLVVFKNLKQRGYFLTLTFKDCAVPCGMTVSHCNWITEVIQQKVDGGVDGNQKTPSDKGVVITHVGPPPNDKMTKTILGVFCGVTFSVILVVFLGYWYRDKGIKCGCISPPVPPGIKQTPTILLLYSADFEAHKKAVEKLACLLMQGFDCKVHFDMFELDCIQEWGLDKWLEENIKPPNFIMFVCTAGGRLQFSLNNRRFYLNKNHQLEDYFSTAVRYVTKSSDPSRENVAVVSFSYATKGDIPPQLDISRKFVLRDATGVEALYRYLRHSDKMPQDISNSVEDFLNAMAEAKTWLDKNPNCFQKLPDPKHVEKPNNSKRYRCSIQNNTVPLDKGSRLSDNSWLENCPLNPINRSYSQPSSLHSSDEVLRIVESSKSLACLDRQMSVSDEHFEVCQRLLGHRRQIDSDSDCEEIGTRSLSMSVDVHRTGQGSSSESPPPGNTRSSSSAESDIDHTVLRFQTPIDPLEVRRIVDRHFYYIPQQPSGYKCFPTEELKSIPLTDPPPNSTEVQYYNFSVDRDSNC